MPSLEELELYAKYMFKQCMFTTEVLNWLWPLKWGRLLTEHINSEAQYKYICTIAVSSADALKMFFLLILFYNSLKV